MKISVFTPTYNRAQTLPRLYASLRSQSCNDFEWLVIDDGSDDNTAALFDEWISEDNNFPIRYYQVANGGKNRAINKGVELSRGEYMLILDSDDMLVVDAVEFYLSKLREISDTKIIGISGRRGNLDGTPLQSNCKTAVMDYVDCTNLERISFGLNRDMAEVYRIDILRKYPFPVWHNEKFTPEEVIWNRIASDGYKLRWFNRVTYLCEYQQDGLTNGAFKLLKDNPMGYAMMYNLRMEYAGNLKDKCNNVIQFLSCCILASELSYIWKSNCKILSFLLLPIGFVLAVRRRLQFKRMK